MRNTPLKLSSLFSNHLFPGLLACGAMLLGFAGRADATLLAYEGFDTPGQYTAGATLDTANGGTGWTGAWSSEASVTTELNSVAYPDLVETSGHMLTTNGDPSSSRRSFDETGFQNLGDEVWFAYTFNRESGSNNHNVYITLSGSSTRFFGLRTENSPSTELNAAIRFAGSTVEKSSTAYTIANSTDYFVIGRMTFDDVGNDRLDVWVNPSDFTSVANLGAESMFVETANPTPGNFTDVWIADGNAASYAFDEIRIGNTLGDVAPSSVPEPVTSAMVFGFVIALGAIAYRRRMRK